MLQIIVMIVYLAVLILFLLCGLRKNCSNDLLDRETSSSLKGFAIMLVFIHHFGQLSSPFYYEHSFLGYLGVTIFLLIAGYVSQKQLMLKGKKYIGLNFVCKKIVRLYIPFIVITVFFAIIGRHQISELIYSLIHIEKDWFLSAVTIFYLMFWMAGNIMKNYVGGVQPYYSLETSGYIHYFVL